MMFDACMVEKAVAQHEPAGTRGHSGEVRYKFDHTPLEFGLNILVAWQSGYAPDATARNTPPAWASFRELFEVFPFQ